MKTRESSLSTDIGLMIESCFSSKLIDLDTHELSQKFRENYSLLLRNFDVSVDSFKQFTELLSVKFLPYVGGAYSRESIDGDKTLLSVTGHKVGNVVPFHGEMYYKKQKPDMMWFYCATPAKEEGETTLCDGLRVYEELSPATQKLLVDNPIKYIRTYKDGAWQQIYQTSSFEAVEDVCQVNGMTVQLNKDNSITTEYICSALITEPANGKKVFLNNILPVYYQEKLGKHSSIVRFEDDSKLSDSVIHEIRAVTDRLAIAIKWQAGDILMLDNQRLLHGRRAFSDPNREIYVRLCNRQLAT